MHLLTNTEAITLNKTLGKLEPGSWVMHDLNAFEIAQKAPRGTVTNREHGWTQLLSQEEGAPTLVMRSGAIGDLLMLTPALRAMGEPKPTICCFPHMHAIFEHSGFPVESYPLALSRVGQYGKIISLEDTLETDFTHNGADVFAKALDVPTPLKNYRPLYTVTDTEKALARKHLFSGRPNVAIQPRSSISNRDYPSELWYRVMVELERRGWGILLLGKKNQVPRLPPQMDTPFIRNLADLDLPLREAVAVLSLCDAFAGIDSSMMHFAAALDIPAVSLHGPFPWSIRTANYPNNTALTGRGECAGCCWHMTEGAHFPPNKPCTKRGYCVVLADIHPDRIATRIDLLK